MSHRLTDEQRVAAGSNGTRVYIEAAPGSGKTTVAAERFGVLRYETLTDKRPVVALSFTRSATAELTERIRNRWGSAALTWPHRVMTFDSMHCEIFTYLLRTNAITWPGDLTEIQVLDVWNGQKGSRPLFPNGSWKQRFTLAGTTVVARGTKVTSPTTGLGAQADAAFHLSEGRCTHDDVRNVVRAAFRNDELLRRIIDFIKANFRALVVDEVFDGDVLDLYLIQCAAHVGGVSVTVIGDPWQALYGFRGAKPELVPRLLEGNEYEHHLISRSFRFETSEMQRRAIDLRDKQPTLLPTIPTWQPAELDVVLGHTWDSLWNCAPNVLPLSFGQITNRSTAAMILLLDQLVCAAFDLRATFVHEAMSVLKLDSALLRSNGPQIFGSVLALLKTDGFEADQALEGLRVAISDLGSPIAIRRLAEKGESTLRSRIERLSIRVRSPAPLVPGLTIHQAKGREWARVGVQMSALDIAAVESGLDREIERHRAIYVALTRARRSVVAFA